MRIDRAALRHRALAGWAWLRHGRVRLPVAILSLTALVVALVVVTSVGGGSSPVALPPVPPAPATTSATASPSGSPTPSARRPAARHRTRPAKRAPSRCTMPQRTGGGSAPLHVCIPAIGVDASIMRLGLNPDRTVEVPPLSRVGDAGWYRWSAAPGAVGPTVILGHVDSAEYGDGVFYHLGDLHAGDLVRVTRDDGRVATFVITRMQEIAKDRFPTMAVYGATSGPSIRLITCGGSFDASTGNYLDNIIAYGTLQSLRERA